MRYRPCHIRIDGEHHFCLGNNDTCCQCGQTMAQLIMFEEFNDDGSEENLD